MKVPQPPHIDGLPLWANIIIAVLFCLVGLGAAISGYFRRGGEKASPDTPASAAVIAASFAASFAEGAAQQSLQQSVVRLDESVKSLTDAIEDHAHHERNSVDVSRELCGRVRELTEELRRQKG